MCQRARHTLRVRAPERVVSAVWRSCEKISPSSLRALELWDLLLLLSFACELNSNVLLSGAPKRASYHNSTSLDENEELLWEQNHDEDVMDLLEYFRRQMSDIAGVFWI